MAKSVWPHGGCSLSGKRNHCWLRSMLMKCGVLLLFGKPKHRPYVAECWLLSCLGIDCSCFFAYPESISQPSNYYFFSIALWIVAAVIFSLCQDSRQQENPLESDLKFLIYKIWYSRHPVEESSASVKAEKCWPWIFGSWCWKEFREGG